MDLLPHLNKEQSDAFRRLIASDECAEIREKFSSNAEDYEVFYFTKQVWAMDRFYYRDMFISMDYSKEGLIDLAEKTENLHHSGGNLADISRIDRPLFTSLSYIEYDKPKQAKYLYPMNKAGYVRPFWSKDVQLDNYQYFYARQSYGIDSDRFQLRIFEKHPLRDDTIFCNATTYKLNQSAMDILFRIKTNSAPEISGKDEDLGNISDEISKTYTVFDEDDDKLSIIERLNNTVIGVHNDVKSGTSKTLTIPKEDIYKLPIGKKNTISIEVSDGQEKTYRNWTFTRTNTAPIIQVLTDTELGNIIKPFETKIKVSDPEHDKVNVTYTVNRIVLDENESYTRIPVHAITKENIELDSELKYTIDREVWDKLLIGDYELEIKAIDDQSGENKEVITFTRTEDEIEFITPAIVKDVQPKQFISLWLINGNPTNIKIEACNNGLDDKPTWEDVTAEATEAIPYNFKNSAKTADKWAVMAKVSLDGRGGSK